MKFNLPTSMDRPMRLKTDGLDFNNIKQVQQWLNQYGANIATDNMYGKNTNAAIDNVLKNVVLTGDEKQKFLDLQNRMKGKWVGQKKSSPSLSYNQFISLQSTPSYNFDSPNLIDETKGTTPGAGISTIKSEEVSQGNTQLNNVPNLQESSTDYWTNRPTVANFSYNSNRSNTTSNTNYNSRYNSGSPLLDIGRKLFDTLFSRSKPNKEVGSYYSNMSKGNPYTVSYQQGGTMNNQEELQKAFLAFLIQDAAQQGIQLQSEQDLQAYAEQLGEEGIKAKYQEFMQKMQGGVMARLGAKLDYYKKLKGVCPDGYEMTYYKVGGRLCTTCQKKAMAQDGKKLNAVEKFKQKRKEFKKDMSKGDQASRDSIAINKWNDQETMAERGNRGKVKNGVWTPDRKKYSKKD